MTSMFAESPTVSGLTPAQVLHELRSQHGILREILDSCEALADDLDRGRATSSRLHAEVARLCRAFDVHNAFEEQLLRPLLHRTDTFAEARIARLVDDHVAEHRMMGLQLQLAHTTALRDVIETLRAHLDAEERYLLTERVFAVAQGQAALGAAPALPTTIESLPVIVSLPQS